MWATQCDDKPDDVDVAALSLLSRGVVVVVVVVRNICGAGGGCRGSSIYFREYRVFVGDAAAGVGECTMRADREAEMRSR